jgi:hypothetical protein
VPLASREKVIAEYSLQANQTFSSGTLFNPSLKIKDIHNIVTTGAAWNAKVPYSGDWRVSLYSKQSATTRCDLAIRINGVVSAGLVSFAVTSGTIEVSGGFSYVAINLVQGDVITLVSGTGTSWTMLSGARVVIESVE